MISKDDKDKIIQKLNQKLENNIICPMCKNKYFIIADGYFNSPMQDNFDNISIGGPSIPSIPIICNNCGFISLHALGILHLLPDEKEK